MKYVLSDIHGNLEAFNSILKKINFSDEDELFILGDVVDRGKYGINILQRIMNMPNAKMILGNHEYMMLSSLGFPYEKDQVINLKEDRDLWYHNGGGITHKSLLKLNKDEQIKIINYLLKLPLNIITEAGDKKFVLCHAAPEIIYNEFKKTLGDDLKESKAFFCVWDREAVHYLADSGQGKVKFIFGHTPTIHLHQDENKVSPMEIYEDNDIIGIDCGAAYPNYGGRLSCIRLDDMEVFYS